MFCGSECEIHNDKDLIHEILCSSCGEYALTQEFVDDVVLNQEEKDVVAKFLAACRLKGQSRLIIVDRKAGQMIREYRTIQLNQILHDNVR